MKMWITENAGTILIALALAAIVAAIIAKKVRNRKTGASACGCGCVNCAMSGICHGKERE